MLFFNKKDLKSLIIYSLKIVFLNLVFGIFSYIFFRYFLIVSDIHFFNWGLIILIVLCLIFTFLNFEKLNLNLQKFDIGISTQVITFTFILNWILLSPIIQGGHKYFYTVGGIIPFSDGAIYFENLANWPSNYFNIIGSWRAINGIIDILIFYLGGKTLLGFLLVRALLISLVFGNYAKVIANQVGNSSAIIQILFLIYWILPFTNSTLTETNGLILSVAGFSLLIAAIVKQNFKNWILAITLIGLANISRPYSVLLPFTLLVTIYFFKQLKYKPGIISLIILYLVVLTIVFPSWIHRKIGAPGSDNNGNSACVILGITRNTNWSETFSEYESKYINLSNSDKNKLMMKEAFINFKSKPKLTFLALIKTLNSSYLGFFTNLFSLILPKSFFSNFLILFSLTFWLIMFLISYKFWKKYNLIIVLFWIAILNYFIFFPIVYEAGGWRIVASLILPFTLLFVLLVEGLKQLSLELRLTAQVQPQPNKLTNHIEFIPKFIGLIVITSICFMFLTRKLKIKSSKFEFKLNFVENESEIGWKSFNEASISKEGFIKWLNVADYRQIENKPVVHYFDSNFKHFEKIIYNNNELVLIKKNKNNVNLIVPHEKDFPTFFWPRFVIKE